MEAAYGEGVYAALAAGAFAGHDPDQDSWSWTSPVTHMDNPDYLTLATVFASYGHEAHVPLDDSIEAVESVSASTAPQDRSPQALLAAPPGL